MFDLGFATCTVSPTQKPGLPSYSVISTAVKENIITESQTEGKERIGQPREKVVGTEQKKPEKKERAKVCDRTAPAKTKWRNEVISRLLGLTSGLPGEEAKPTTL